MDVWEVDASEFPSDGSIEDRVRFLLRYAILAPSSHNSQPWAFSVDGRTVEVHAVEDRPLSDSLMERLRVAVVENDVSLRLIEDDERKRSIGTLQAEADRVQMANSEYRKELGYWIGAGALGDSWLKARIGQAVVTHLNVGDREAQKNSKLVRSAPFLGVLSTNSDAPTARVETGQVYERLALAATAEGVATHPVSQIRERAEMREELAALLDGDDASPQHLFRLGYPQREQGHTPRWPLDTFLVDGA